MPLSVIHTPEALREACARARSEGKRVGLVPTMGALHEGHAALVRDAASRAGFVVVSIFVNPTQFGPNEDFERYPRTLDKDVELCASAGADCVFAPNVRSMYPEGEATRVQVTGLTAPLCGAQRPGHFDGVATVVSKFFILTGPCVAVFGRKDYQQLKVIERMARDLLMPVEVVGHRIVREADGLAMSSRNRYLSEQERARAAQIPRALTLAWQAFGKGERNAGVLRGLVRRQLEQISSRIDYVDVADPETIRVAGDQEELGARALLALAAQVGPARLIDNVVLGEDPAPCEVAP